MFKQAHKQRPTQCVMTMMTFRTGAPSSCGIVELDDKGIVIGFHEKVANPPGNLANGAVYILSAELLKKMDNELSAAKDFSTEILGQFVGQIYTYQTDEIFMDIGSIPAYEKVSNL
jgi:mannose-1-phosphate guanylyltransferase